LQEVNEEIEVSDQHATVSISSSHSLVQRMKRLKLQTPVRSRVSSLASVRDLTTLIQGLDLTPVAEEPSHML
jgi:hypothetical protein